MSTHLRSHDPTPLWRVPWIPGASTHISIKDEMPEPSELGRSFYLGEVMGVYVVMSPHLKLDGDEPFVSPFWAVQSSAEPNCEVQMIGCSKYKYDMSIPVITNSVDLQVGDVLTIKKVSAAKGGEGGGGGGDDGGSGAGGGGGNGGKRKRPSADDVPSKAGARAKTKAKAKAKVAA